MNHSLGEKDYTVFLNSFKNSMYRLAKNKTVMKKLELSNKTHGVLAEVYAVLRLHEAFKTESITWKGGQTRSIDLKLGDIDIQVKKITGKNDGRFYWNWKDTKLEENPKGSGIHKTISYKTIKKLKCKFTYPYLFVYMENLNKPIFLCFSKEEMLRLYGKTIKSHNA